MKPLVSLTAVLLVLALLLGRSEAAEVPVEHLSTEQINFFEARIRPVLVRECYSCHSNKTGSIRGGLRLDTRDVMREGGESGPAIVPGNLEESLLYGAITHQDFVMPPERKLPQKVIDDFRKWIEMGAPDPRVATIAEIKSSISSDDIQQAKQTFWAYQSPAATTPPTVENTKWPKTEIDQFILAKLEQADLVPTKDTEVTKLLRRLHFDLVGLPPSPAQIAQFSKAWSKDSEQAVADVVDELLATPQYGERWGRHWLDVVRFAESTGNAVNMTFPHAWRYRDYVIDSFNVDKPFDRFIQEQLAGDLLPAETDETWAKNLVATGFLAIGTKNINEQARAQFTADVVDEQIDATSRVFLGTSVACARCHDHKFDAIPQSDYYAMAGIFGSTETYFGNPSSNLIRRPQARQASSLILLPVEDPNPYDQRYTREELDDLRAEVADKKRQLLELRRQGANNAQLRRLINVIQMSQLVDKLAVVDEVGNPLSYCMGVQDAATPRDARILSRGEIDEPGQIVERGFPQILSDGSDSLPKETSGRLQMAQWIASAENPLTARVMVNRIWQHLLGQGLVSSPDNFGVTGQLPTHPELLDHLATEFVNSGWSVKQMVRAIATSRVYRLASTYDEHSHNLDPGNTLLWRANPRRLDAEAIRDTMLAISGKLDLERPRGSEVAKAGYVRVQNGVLGNVRDAVQRIGGRELIATAMNARNTQLRGNRTMSRAERRALGREAVINKVTSLLDMEEAVYRSVYLPIVRDATPRSLHVFDFADSNAVVGARDASNTADQALYLMNNPFVIQQSKSLANRIEKMSSRQDRQIEIAFLLAYGRRPTAGEQAAATSFIDDFAISKTQQETLAALCQSLFASAEFRYVY